MYIKKIIIKDFKNFTTETTFEFTPKSNIIVGKNGCGKTSILDAIVWALIGRMFNSSQQGWKPKILYTDADGNSVSKPKDLFNTSVEVIIGFEDGQKDISIKRTSCCGRSTVLYFNNIVDTQKQINKYLEDLLGFDLTKLLVYSNPEILFNPDEVSQQECGKIIFDSVRHKAQEELAQLYAHLFDEYNLGVNYLQEGSLEKSIAKKIVSDIKRKLDSNVSENEIIEDLESKIEANNQVLATKNETMKSQELVLNEYNLHLKQESAYKQLEQQLDKAEQALRTQLFERSKIATELSSAEKDKNTLVVWLNDFNELLTKNPSNDEIKKAFGLAVNNKNVSATKINVLSQAAQRVKCPVCGNWYVPKPQQPSGVLKNMEDINKKKEQTISQTKIEEDKPFDYLPKLAEIKKQIADLKIQIDDLNLKLANIDKTISYLEFKSTDELQAERNNVSRFFASLETGKNIQKQVNRMKLDCEECNLNNKYMNILLETIKSYVKEKLRIIMKKLNQNLTSGMISLFKIQTNGVLKECVSIIDKTSNASYSETNQSNKIKLGIEVCNLLQDFNNIDIPIFIDEIGRFNDYSFINNIKHQIIATQPTNETEISIKHSQ